uniref:Secreted protein n=1 Tax=Heterorhabditis bacteriophora TaxID=37862 RepID=A0A1I7XNU4_HETBA
MLTCVLEAKPWNVICWKKLIFWLFPAMTKITPVEDYSCDPSTSVEANSRIGILVTMATKVFGSISRRFDCRPSFRSCEDGMEMGKRSKKQDNYLPNLAASLYQQSSTRRLAFGSSTYDTETSKPMNDFYNNSTLSNLSKMFCAVILLTASKRRSVLGVFAYEGNRRVDTAIIPVGGGVSWSHRGCSLIDAITDSGAFS